MLTHHLYNLDAPTTYSSPIASGYHHEMEPESGETAQIVVDLKKLGVDLDKDVGRSIQKSTDEVECPDVSKESVL